jgi:hypothetical protein
VTPAVPPITLPTHQFTGAGGVLFGVTLKASGGCIWLEGDIVRYTAIWPAGYSARGTPAQLIAPDGRIVAKEGDRLEVDATGRNGIAITSCQVSPDVLIVGTVVSVNGIEVPSTPSPATQQPRPAIR